MLDIKQWIEENKLDAIWKSDKIFSIDDKSFLLIEQKDQNFNDEFIPILNDEEFALWDEYEYFCFLLGSNWYYSHKDNEKTQLNILKYLGQCRIDFENSSFLGVHGKYELANGSRDYKDWCKKAKFLGIKTLGIVENNTLAGTHLFQQACKEYGIKHVLGMQCSVEIGFNSFAKIKIYVKNEIGWSNLLNIHKKISVDNLSPQQHIKIHELNELKEGLIFILNSDIKIDENILEIFSELKPYYQIDTVEWKSGTKEIEHLENLKSYFDNHFDSISPIIICDAYYLDKSDSKIKRILNKIVKTGFYNDSNDQYFKSNDNIYEQLIELFKDDDSRLEKLINASDINTDNIISQCDFDITRTDSHLPKYEMNEDEKIKFKSSDELFFDIIEKGLGKFVFSKIPEEKHDIYLTRLENEITVLQEGKVVDYFLILWDIIRYASTKGVYQSIGRGSAAGSLVAYLMGITRIDPIEYDLLFERFLNKARLLGGSLPDIDYDTASNNRQDIIDYIINKYGREQVACIGVSQNFKLKSTLKDLIKLGGADFSYSNFLSSMIGKEYDFSKVEGLFELSCKEPKIKDALQKYHHFIEMIDLCIFQPRSFGIHAAAVIIAPKFDKNGKRTRIWDYAPIRLADGQYVTEWEKETVENIGLLKEDILGLTQLDKFMRINELIKQSGEEVPSYYDVDFEDEKVFKLFKEGLTEDVFQFNTSGLKQYCIDLQPDDINDLVAANALYRPGAMESNSHNKYVKIKHGQEQSVLPKGLEDIMESTYGLYIYQEQAMLSYQKVTNCDLNEADNFRKVITKLKPGKKNPDIEKYEEIFKEAYMKMIDDKSMVDDTWNKIIAFATYGFNKCIHEDSLIAVYESDKVNIKTEKIKALYEKFHSGESIYVQSHINGELQPAKVKNVFYTGKKELYEIKLENEKSIKSSKDHKFLTLNGWKRLEELSAGDFLLHKQKTYLFNQKEYSTLYTKIKTIVQIEDGETYDIEIDNEEHNYVANGIVVHNSHAASYSVTGYVAQWYKCYYPLEFYTAALEFSTDDSKKTIIQEINARKLVELKAPDVNKSTHNYTIDYETNSIYWSFTSIKFVGDKAIEAIIEERNKSGRFESFENFIERLKGSKVNKRVIENLIFSGAFDEIENIQNAKERLSIWKKYSGDIMPPDFTDKTLYLEHTWILKQNAVSGFGEIPFEKIFKATKSSAKMVYYSNSQMQEIDKLIDRTIVVGGLIHEVKIMNTKRGQAARIQLNQNNDLINITMWNETWENYKSAINNSENKNKIFFISGSVKLDRSGKKIIMTNNESKIELI